MLGVGRWPLDPEDLRAAWWGRSHPRGSPSLSGCDQRLEGGPWQPPGAWAPWAAGGPALCLSSRALVPQVIFLYLSLNFYSNPCFQTEKVDFFSSRCKMCVIPRKASLAL